MKFSEKLFNDIAKGMPVFDGLDKMLNAKILWDHLDNENSHPVIISQTKS